MRRCPALMYVVLLLRSTRLHYSIHSKLGPEPAYDCEDLLGLYLLISLVPTETRNRQQ